MLLRNTPFLLYVLTGACMIGTLLAYITGSAFIYIETLGVTPGLFAVLFGVNAIGFVGASQLNRLLLRRLSMVSVIRGAVTAAVLIGMGLLVVVASGHASTRTLTVLFIAQAATVGATLPNITALALGSVRERMGSAAALQGTAQSVVAGVAGWLVGMLSNGAALPVMGIITGFAALAAVFLLVAHRWQPGTHMVLSPFPLQERSRDESHRERILRLRWPLRDIVCA
jgi:DHA1 family bicyclomycin/chloramphenicol resistance-like MFS transporter